MAILYDPVCKSMRDECMSIYRETDLDLLTVSMASLSLMCLANSFATNASLDWNLRSALSKKHAQ
jgi:hypothetical protein